MLVLSRKAGERILIGDEIKITIVRIGPNTVRLGIDAPGHLNIVREELCDQQMLGTISLDDSSIEFEVPPQ
jgi:carbon storage regulator